MRGMVGGACVLLLHNLNLGPFSSMAEVMVGGACVLLSYRSTTPAYTRLLVGCQLQLVAGISLPFTLLWRSPRQAIQFLTYLLHRYDVTR
jgi:hypothetical protein